ncbi:flagellar protein [Rhizobium cremeum]|uniref:flagellar protein n=1 Tax=Rhizobium cremeum TaxID=2813827 RepID=UPI000DD547E2|nr:flagellar protein [Rhizobium cremeum]MCJ7997063.1 flagellar protein [Rhizobium cremeum]MCJ8002281.1 flagellar protein [Rhizobium cremeum]
MKKIGKNKHPVSHEPGAEENRTTAFDRWLTGGIMAIAAAAAAFPWYVFFNQDKFGVSVAGWESLRDLPQGRGRGGVAIGDPSEERLNAENRSDLPAGVNVDPLTTATVSRLGPEGAGDGDSRETQPFPGGSDLRLLHVANGRALIEDKTGIFIVQIGSILPDNSRLAAFRQREGKWEIVTSTGAVYSE